MSPSAPVHNWSACTVASSRRLPRCSLYRRFHRCSLSSPPRPPPHSRTAPRDQRPPVTFRVEVNYVEIDAIVTDAQGNFVRDLTKDDFQVLEDGKPQDLTVCRWSTSRSSGPTRRSSRRPPSSPTCAATARSSTAACSCWCSTTCTRTSRRASGSATPRSSSSSATSAPTTSRRSSQTGARKDGAQEFTSNRALLLKAIDNFAGQKIRSATLDKIDDYYMQREYNRARRRAILSEAERAYKARNTLSTLRQVADYLAGVRGRRKAVVYFSEGIDYDIDNPIQNRYASGAPGRDAGGDCRGDARQRQLLRRRSARPERPERRRRSTSSSLPERPDARPRLRRRLRTSCADRRTACASSPTRPAASRPSTGTTSATPSRASSRTTAATTCSATTRPTPGATAGSGKRAGPGEAAGPDGPGAQAATSRRRASRRRRRRRRTQATSPALREALDSPIPISGLGLSVFAAPFKGAAPNASIARDDRNRRPRPEVRQRERAFTTTSRSACSRSTGTPRSRTAAATSCSSG